MTLERLRRLPHLVLSPGGMLDRWAPEGIRTVPGGRRPYARAKTAGTGAARLPPFGYPAWLRNPREGGLPFGAREYVRVCYLLASPSVAATVLVVGRWVGERTDAGNGTTPKDVVSVHGPRRSRD